MGGAYGDLLFKVMFNSVNGAHSLALPQTTTNIIITFKLSTLFKFTFTLDNNTGEISGSALFSSLPPLTARQYSLMQLADPVMSDPTVKNKHIYN